MSSKCWYNTWVSFQFQTSQDSFWLFTRQIKQFGPHHRNMGSGKMRNDSLPLWKQYCVDQTPERKACFDKRETRRGEKSWQVVLEPYVSHLIWTRLRPAMTTLDFSHNLHGISILVVTLFQIFDRCYLRNSVKFEANFSISHDGFEIQQDGATDCACSWKRMSTQL